MPCCVLYLYVHVTTCRDFSHNEFESESTDDDGETKTMYPRLSITVIIRVSVQPAPVNNSGSDCYKVKDDVGYHYIKPNRSKPRTVYMLDSYYATTCGYVHALYEGGELMFPICALSTRNLYN